MTPITPVGITIARLASLVLIGLLIIQGVLTVRGVDWGPFAERGGGVVIFSVILVAASLGIGIAILGLPLWLIRRGSRATAVVVTLIAAWQTYLAVFLPDVLGIISAAVAIAGAVAIWLAPSRAHLSRVREERLARRREAVYPQRRR